MARVQQPHVFSVPTTTQSPDPRNGVPPSKTADDTLKDWESKLGFKLYAELKEPLSDLALGRLPPVSAPRSAQRVWEILLKHGAFDVFVEVFDICSRLETALSQSQGKSPFEPSLILMLPQDWAPNEDTVASAFSRIRVKNVTVMLPPEPRMEVIPKISEAVCRGLAVLLKNAENGLTDLTICGDLSLPDVVAQAFGKSQLTSIGLRMAIGGRGVPGSGALERFGTLMRGLQACTTLKNLQINDQRLFGLHAAVQALRTSGGLALESFQLGIDVGSDQPHNVQELARMVQVIAEFKTLTSFKLHETGDPSSSRAANRPDKVEHVLRHLQWHSSLEHLIVDAGANAPEAVQQSRKDLSKALELTATLPSLKSFRWQEGPVLGMFDKLPDDGRVTMHRLRSAGVDLEMPLESLAQRLESQKQVAATPAQTAQLRQTRDAPPELLMATTAQPVPAEGPVNNDLMAAVNEGSPEHIAQLLSGGAIDTGRHAFNRAFELALNRTISAEVLLEFYRFDPSLRRF